MNINQRIRLGGRYRQIIKTLIKHGLGYLIHRWGLEGAVPVPVFYLLHKCDLESDACMAENLTSAIMELDLPLSSSANCSAPDQTCSPAFIEELEKLR